MATEGTTVVTSAEATHPGARSAPDGSPPLPCLLSNNSDEPRVKRTGVERKRAERTRRNIEHFQSKLEAGTMGVMTITFPTDISTREANRRRANFTRRVLKENFGESISVREFTQRKRPHFHLAIDCKGDISTGFNWPYYKAVRDWYKKGQKGEKPVGSLNRTPHLAELHRILNEKAPLYGLGRIELAPVEKPAGIAFYLGGYLAKGADHKPDDAKGTRAVNYSRACPQIMSLRWSWANESGWCWRKKLELWAAKHGCKSLPEVKAVFGSKWAYHHREAILATIIPEYPTQKHASADGVIQLQPGTTVRELVEEIFPTLPRRHSYRLQEMGQVSGSLAEEEDRAKELRDIAEALTALQRATVSPPAPTPQELETMRWLLKYSQPYECRAEEDFGESRAPARCSPRTARAEQPSEIDTGSAGSGQVEEQWAAALAGKRLYVLKRPSMIAQEVAQPRHFQRQLKGSGHASHQLGG